MFALLVALVAWIALSIIATPLIGRFLVLHTPSSEREPVNPQAETRHISAASATRYYANRRPNRVRTAAR
jgi:hypothetical protein